VWQLQEKRLHQMHKFRFVSTARTAATQEFWRMRVGVAWRKWDGWDGQEYPAGQGIAAGAVFCLRVPLTVQACNTPRQPLDGRCIHCRC
jgi:hypothetical protein